MKKTPLQQAIEQIRTQAEDYQKRGNNDKSAALLDSINLLQSLLPYERECFVETHEDAVSNYCDYQSVPGTELVSAQDYFTNTYKQ